MKRRNLYCICFILLTVIAACSPTDRLCHIHGTLPSDKYNDAWIFLVPLHRPDSVGVDSVQIKGRQFEFTTDRQIMAILRMHYKHRYGLQELLVVTEAGNVEVVIDSVSSGRGTPQNDSLQVWKERTERCNIECRPFRIEGRNAERAGNTVVAETMKAKVDSIRRKYRKASHEMGESMKDTPLGEFLMTHFPKTYKQKMPDGSTKEIPLF